MSEENQNLAQKQKQLVEALQVSQKAASDAEAQISEIRAKFSTLQETSAAQLAAEASARKSAESVVESSHEKIAALESEKSTLLCATRFF